MYNKKIIFAGACIGLLFFGMGLITLGSIVQELKQKYQLDEVSSGTLFSILPFGILVGSLLFGPFCDKYGYKQLLSLACCCMFIGFEGIAFAPTNIILQISIFLVGVGGGAINGGTSALVSDISDKDKGADLNLLGVSFGIGALGMPFMLGILKHRLDFESIVSIVGFFTLAIGIFYTLIKFPPPKQSGKVPLFKNLSFLKDPLIILIAFFLFCQSSFEAIVNNWTTTYLSDQFIVEPSKVLYALSLFVAGMTIMRFLLGTIFRNTPVGRIWVATFAMILLGVLLLASGISFYSSVAGLILLGAGLGGGFPIMLGFVGHRYKAQSGTAFSFVLVIALVGNMGVNYGMGIIAKTYGIHHLITVMIAELSVMIMLCLGVLYRLKKQ